MPVGERYQQTLYLFKKVDGKLVSTALLPTLVRADDRSGRGRPRNQAGPGEPAYRQRQLSKNWPRICLRRRPCPGRKPCCRPSRLRAKRPSRSAGTISGSWNWSNPGMPPTVGIMPALPTASRGGPAAALQGMAVDGRKVHELEFSLWVRAVDVKAGRNNEEVPILGVNFYDENRATVGDAWLGPWKGTFGWRREVELIAVPPQAREAVLRIGLHGGVGEICFDDIQVKPVRRK